MKFESMPSTQPYLDPYLGMSRTFGVDLRMYGIVGFAYGYGRSSGATIFERKEREEWGM